MKLRLRQIALAVTDLAAARASVLDLFDLDQYHQDPAVERYGLHNAVYGFGNSFLEILTPVVGNTTVGRLLTRRGGDCGYMVILQTDAINEARARLGASGVRIVDQLDRERAGFTHLHPRDVGGTLLSIDYMDEWDRWEWAGPGWQSRAAPASELAITGAEMQATDPGKMAVRWSTALGRPVESHGEGHRIVLDEGELRFIALHEGRDEGFNAFDIRSAQPDAIRSRARQFGCLLPDGTMRFCGMTVRLLDFVS